VNEEFKMEVATAGFVRFTIKKRLAAAKVRRDKAAKLVVKLEKELVKLNKKAKR
jgi:hypothetical protein